MHFELPWWSLIILAPAYGIMKVGDKIRKIGRKKYKPEKEETPAPEQPETPDPPLDGA